MSDAKGWDGICSKVGAKANVQLSRTFVLLKNIFQNFVRLVSTHGCGARRRKSHGRNRKEKKAARKRVRQRRRVGNKTFKIKFLKKVKVWEYCA